MKTKSVAIAVAVSMLFGTAAFAGGSSKDCGCVPPPPTQGKAKKPNSGVGNGGEPLAGSYKEVGDRDPGRSGAHNQAFKNSDKPRSAAAQMP